MTQHFEALESGLMQTYGLDAREVFFGPAAFGGRRLMSLVKGLPPDGPLNRTLDPEGWNWTPDTQFAAALIEAMWTNITLFWKVNFKGKPPEIPTIQRPGMAAPKAKPKQATSDEMRSVFGGKSVLDGVTK